MARRDYGKRLAVYFADADAAILQDCNAMLAKHSAAGRLQSGATLQRAAEIWIEHTGRQAGCQPSSCQRDAMRSRR